MAWDRYCCRWCKFGAAGNFRSFYSVDDLEDHVALVHPLEERAEIEARVREWKPRRPLWRAA